MTDIENIVFDKVANAFDDAYPNGSRYSEPVETMADTPDRFPCVTLWQCDNASYRNSRDAEGEHHARLMYQLDVYSNLVTDAKQECKDVTDLIDKAMLEMGFTRISSVPTKNQNSRIYRITTRYRGVIGDDNILYTR